MTQWQRVDVKEALGGSGMSLDYEGEDFAGAYPRGFEATVRILHAAYESPQPADLTYDEDEKRRLQAGELEPQIIGQVNLSTETVSTGIPLGLAGRPSGWRRVTWRELAHRFDAVVDPTEPPSMPMQIARDPGWPISIQPPPEGSLDTESLEALVSVLTPSTGDQDCYFYYCMLAVRPFEPRFYRGPLASVVDLATCDDLIGSPQNWWPADSSWLVYTDYDLSETMIGGARGLIDASVAHPDLETLAE